MNGKEIGEALEAACHETEGRANLRSGGNVGMAFLAYSIVEHANAIRNLSETINKCFNSDKMDTK